MKWAVKRCAGFAPAGLRERGRASLIRPQSLFRSRFGCRPRWQRALGPHLPLQAVWLGLDVACDVYIGVGTALFGFSMLRHPRFGWVFGGGGIAIALALLCVTLYTFPAPPADAGLVDLGPALGVWYLAVTLRTWQSLDWAQGAVRNVAT